VTNLTDVVVHNIHLHFCLTDMLYILIVSDVITIFLSAVFGLVWFGLVWFGLVWFGLVWFGLVWFDSFYVRVSAITTILMVGHRLKSTPTNGHQV